MARASSFCGLILAAGESSRMGREKALLPWRETTFLEAHLDVLKMYTDMVLVVAGNNAAALQPVVDARAAYLVRNPAPEQGQFSSLRVGVQEILNHGRDAAIIALVDRPPAQPHTISYIRQAFEESPSGIWAVVPEHRGHHGHPIVVGREMITAFLQAPAFGNAREVEHACQEHVAYLTVEDEFTIANINTPEDYQRIRQ